jgi:2-(1,2-epoxy-1,2-dihydrophenyl)acetyl-CoA isomerase
MSELVLFTVKDRIATITLNRPDKLNAFAADMRERLVAALDRVAESDARVLVLTGAGRAFCSGGDVQHMVRLAEEGAGFEGMRPLLDLGGDAVTRLATLPIPTLAAVNGVAAGAGMNLAIACDLRIASDQASFGETFVRIGLHPDWGGTFHLPRLVGLARALELCWLGDVIDAAEALRIGLVNRVVPHARLEDEVKTLAARLAAAPETSVRLAKRTLSASPHRTLEQCLAAEAEAQAACWASPDAAEGLRAFAEKRAPAFGGGTAPRSDEALVTAGAAPSDAARLFE